MKLRSATRRTADLGVHKTNRYTLRLKPLFYPPIQKNVIFNYRAKEERDNSLLWRNYVLIITISLCSFVGSLVKWSLALAEMKGSGQACYGSNVYRASLQMAATDSRMDIGEGRAVQYGGCQGPEAMYVKLISSDGHEFVVRREHALTSGTIKVKSKARGN